MTQEVTAEEYKVQVLRQNMSKRFADYEDVIASLQTQIAMLRQRLGEYEADTPRGTVDATEAPSNELAPPAPPVVPEE